MIPGTPPQRILDMGYGSAILAVAAHQRATAMITAADNDQVAIASQQPTVVDHIAPATMHLAVSHGFASRYIRQLAPYDVIFTNILARPLMRMAPDLCPHLAPAAGLFYLAS